VGKNVGALSVLYITEYFLREVVTIDDTYTGLKKKREVDGKTGK
jgi:hypothetical protein